MKDGKHTVSYLLYGFKIVDRFRMLMIAQVPVLYLDILTIIFYGTPERAEEISSLIADMVAVDD